MAERSALTNIFQIGVEATPGTGVQPTHRMSSVGIEPSLSVEIADFRPAGSKYRSLTALGKEWVEASVSGQPTYGELLFPLASVLGAPTMTGASTTTQFTQVFKTSSTGADTVRTYTVQFGDASANTYPTYAGREQFSNGIFTELGLTFSRDGVEMSGSMIGKGFQSTGAGATLDPVWQASPTTLPLVPVLPTEVSVYLSSDYAASTGSLTKLTRATNVEWSISDRFSPLWVLDSALSSFATHVESEPSLSASLTMEADDVGSGLISTMRTGAEKHLTIVCTSGTDSNKAGTKQSLRIDMPVRISDSGGFSDEDGLYAVQWDLLGVTSSSAAWTSAAGAGTACMVTLVNSIDADAIVNM